MDLDYHISSGWLCYQWAYFLQSVLNSLTLSHFHIQKSSLVKEFSGDLPDSIVVNHSWVTLFTCNPSHGRSTNNGVHLDPWINERIDVLFSEEHESRMNERMYAGKRNFFTADLFDKEYFGGYFIYTSGKCLCRTSSNFCKPDRSAWEYSICMVDHIYTFCSFY